jgi:acetyltransferase-like isoleucine patch superfamily enzyme
VSTSEQPTLLESGVIGATFGPGVKIVQPVNIYGCSVGADTFIGPFVEIQRGVAIGRNCRIQSHTFICELVTIGDGCFIGHGVMFVNDLLKDGGPARGDRSKWRATKLGNRVSIGSNCTILPVEIADGTVIGAGAVVVRDIRQPGVYAGNPARRLRSLSD